MSFRDNQVAREEREKVELRDRVLSLKEENERLARELAIAKHKEEQTAEEDAIVNRHKYLDKVAVLFEKISYPFVALGRGIFAVLSFPARIFSSRPNKAEALGGMFIALTILTIVGCLVWQEFYAERDGYVVGKNYYPEHESCSWEETCTGSGSTRSCTSNYVCHTVPPQWTLDIAYQGNSATWSVSESDYEATQYGEWFCARDLLHTDPCVQPPR